MGISPIQAKLWPIYFMIKIYLIKILDSTCENLLE